MAGGGIPIPPETCKLIGMGATLGSSDVSGYNVPELDTSDPDSDVPEELWYILSASESERDSIIDDTLSYCGGRNAVGNESPISPSKDMIQISDVAPRLDMPVENTFKMPAKVDLRYLKDDLLCIEVPPIPKIPLNFSVAMETSDSSQDSLFDSYSVSCIADVNEPMMFNETTKVAEDATETKSHFDMISGSRLLDMRGTTVLQGEDSLASADSEDIIMAEPQALKMSQSSSSKASDGQLNRSFKFGGVPSPNPLKPRQPLTLLDIIPPPSHTRSLPMLLTFEDESVLRSICTKINAMPEAQPQVNSDSSSRGFMREDNRSSFYMDSRHASASSFVGFDSFNEACRGFKFNDSRPSFYPPPAATRRVNHRQQDSIFSIASVSSCGGGVIDLGSVDLFDYSLPSLQERPSMEDMSIAMSMSVDDTFSFIHHRRGLLPPGDYHFRPLSIISLNSANSPMKDDDTMISMLGGGHVRCHSVGSIVNSSPCTAQAGKCKHGAKVFDGYSDSPNKARIIEKPSVASMSSFQFGGECMIKARRGLLERQSLEESCLIAEGEDLSAACLRPLQGPAPARALQALVLVLKLLPFCLMVLKSQVARVKHQPFSIECHVVELHSLNVGNGLQQVYETIEEELNTSSPAKSPPSKDGSSPTQCQLIYIVDSDMASVHSNPEESTWSNKKGITTLCKYYALKDKAYDPRAFGWSGRSVLFWDMHITSLYNLVATYHYISNEPMPALSPASQHASTFIPPPLIDFSMPYLPSTSSYSSATCTNSIASTNSNSTWTIETLPWQELQVFQFQLQSHPEVGIPAAIRRTINEDFSALRSPSLSPSDSVSQLAPSTAPGTIPVAIGAGSATRPTIYHKNMLWTQKEYDDTKPTDNIMFALTKTYFECYYPVAWKAALDKLENMQPLMTYCAGHWKSEMAFIQCLKTRREGKGKSSAASPRPAKKASSMVKKAGKRRHLSILEKQSPSKRLRKSGTGAGSPPNVLTPTDVDNPCADAAGSTERATPMSTLGASDIGSDNQPGCTGVHTPNTPTTSASDGVTPVSVSAPLASISSMYDGLASGSISGGNISPSQIHGGLVPLQDGGSASGGGASGEEHKSLSAALEQQFFKENDLHQPTSGRQHVDVSIIQIGHSFDALTDPNDPALDEDNINEGWGHYAYTSGGLKWGEAITSWESIGKDVSFACRLLAATIKTCQVARIMCFNNSSTTLNYLSDIYLDQIIDRLLEICPNELAMNGMEPSTSSPNPEALSSAPVSITQGADAKTIASLTLKDLEEWVANHHPKGTLSNLKSKKKADHIDAIMNDNMCPKPSNEDICAIKETRVKNGGRKGSGKTKV
ncbi:hypothetical protein BDQ17DRAFT_1334106 [Cyathus striatus]|nr:hypothetical protein BDQ17DRAFT_1334106 [Cyathus striatus]